MKTIIYLFVFFFSGSLFAQEKGQELDKKENIKKEHKIFEPYTWLKDLVDIENCKGVTVSVRKSKTANSQFVFIDRNNKRIMYDSTGKVYCTNSESLKCEDFYKLDALVDSWSCEN